jgi:serine/threonine protein kinase
MNRERWQRITETFDAALECPSEERTSFLKRVCVGDDTLLSEVARLLAEFEKSGDFLEKPLSSLGQAVSAGDLIAGRYRIEVLLGRGGMGEVYRVYDELLDERAALKTLRLDLSSIPAVLKRFQREVQLARKVTHPNVCRVFEVGVHALPDRPLHFFTMPYLDGETLAARIRRTGRISEEEAFPLVTQMAEGLSAAHEAGIIHRDFKSSNVILCDGKAIITDFGLARFETARGSRETASNSSTNFEIAGTVAFMSPEQLSGGKITAASDIYSLGIVLFEMATGQLPFDDRHIIQSAMRRAADAAPDVRALAPKIEPRWAVAIAKCLQRDPAKRFPSTAEVVSYLQPSRWRPSMAYWTRRQWIKATATAGGASLVAVALFTLIPRLAYKDLKAGAKIIVTPAVNATGEERFSPLTTALRASIGQSSRFNLWDDQRLNSVLRSMRREPGGVLTAKDWREIAFREGASFVVFSTLSRIGDGYSLTLHAEQIGAAPDPPMRTWDHTISVPSPNALFDGIHEASAWARTTAGETPNELSGQNHLPQDITSASWEALQLYEKGQHLSQGGSSDQAVPFFRRAIDRDPHFAMALMRLGDILVAQRDGQEGFPLWRRAIVEARAQRLAERERLNLESRYALEIGDYPNAEPILREWMSKFPNDPSPAEWLIPTLRSLGHDEEAISVARAEAQRFGPSTFSTGHLIHALGTSNRLGEIPDQIAVLESLGARTWGLRFRGILAAVQGDYVSAEQYFTKYAAESKGAEASHAVALLATLAAEQRDFPKATILLRSGLDSDKREGQIGLAAAKASGIAYLEYLQGRDQQSREWVLESLSLQSSPQIVMQAVTILARLGDIREASKILDQMPVGEGPGHEARVARARGEMLLARGDSARALSLLEHASTIESATRPKAYFLRALKLAGQPIRAEADSYTKRSRWLVWNFPEVEWPGTNSVFNSQRKGSRD